jgi:hypothetical protein
MAKQVQPISINDVEFDALLDDGRTLPNSVPSYPVEDGFSISDTIIHSPQTLAVTVIITDAAVTHKSRGHGGAGWVARVTKQLEDLYWSGEPVTVKTPDKTYTEMAITDISISAYEGNGYAKQIAINFQKIEVVSSKTTTIPDSYGKSGKSGTNGGTASTNVSNTPAATSASSNSGGSSSSSGGGTESKASIAYRLATGAGLL